jgi:hypothetical protein
VEKGFSEQVPTWAGRALGDSQLQLGLPYARKDHQLQGAIYSGGCDKAMPSTKVRVFRRLYFTQRFTPFFPVFLTLAAQRLLISIS